MSERAVVRLLAAYITSVNPLGLARGFPVLPSRECLLGTCQLSTEACIGPRTHRQTSCKLNTRMFPFSSNDRVLGIAVKVSNPKRSWKLPWPAHSRATM